MDLTVILVETEAGRHIDLFSRASCISKGATVLVIRQRNFPTPERSLVEGNATTRTGLALSGTVWRQPLVGQNALDFRASVFN